MSDIDLILRDARRIEKGGAAALHSSREFEDAMCTLAEREARPGETLGCALSRLQADRDERLATLAKAAHAAESAERAAAQRPEAIAKRLRTQHQAYDLMMKRAEDCAREGESAEDAFDRLAREGDPTFGELYQIYVGG